MPNYIYKCDSCEYVTEEHRSVDDRNAHTACPETPCDGFLMIQVTARVMIRVSNMSAYAPDPKYGDTEAEIKHARSREHLRDKHGKLNKYSYRT